MKKMIFLSKASRSFERTGAREREPSPSKKDWRQFKQFYLSLFHGNDKDDIEELISFMTKMHTTHSVSVAALDQLYKFFYSFSEKMTRLKAHKKARRSYVHMRRKLLAQVPVVLSDILRIATDGEEVEDVNLKKVYKHRGIVRQVSKLSLESVVKHVYSHPKHYVDKENPPVSIDKSSKK